MFDSDEPIRPEVREQMREIGRLIGSAMPPGFGFALLVFDTNTTSGFMNYISNAQRDDVLTAMKEFVARSEGRMPDAPETKQ